MNRADRRRQAKLERSASKQSGKVAQAIADMTGPIVVLLNAHEFDRAEKALNDLLAASPSHPEGLHLYGLLLCQTGRDEQGIDAMRRATSLEPEIALYWYNLATAYAHGEQWELAIEAARKAMELDVNYADPRQLLVNLLLATGKQEEGTDELAKLVKLRPDNADLHLQLARNRNEQERWSEAEEAYKRVLELKPENMDAMRELATIYLSTWQYDAAQRLRKQIDQLEAAGKF